MLPTHDRPHRLGAALASILSQTYERLDVVVVDDASLMPVDETIRTVAGDDPRVRLIHLDANSGAAAARNAGLDHVHGDFVAFLDDDDRWHPSKVERQVSFLEAHPDVGFVSCEYFLVRDGRSMTPVRFRGARTFTAQQLLWANFIGSFSLVMARRSSLGDELRVDEAFWSVEDWDLWLRCARRAQPGVIPEPLVDYVVHHEKRLTDTDIKRRGLRQFAEKHGDAMSASCRAFNRAHQKMDTSSGWMKRAHVLGALATPSPASLLLVVEQFARQFGRLRHDPGLVDRTLARLTESAKR